MARKLNCHCDATPGCNLCHGTGKYEYQSGPMGWMPFTCPNCEGKGVIPDGTGALATCKTCRGQGSVDPANPPIKGAWNRMWKILMGA